MPRRARASPRARAAVGPIGPVGGADLHAHSTHSDGVYSPCEVVRAAAQAGLSAVAITDHDTVSAHESACLEANRLGIELIPGVELTVGFEGREFHLLGYFFDPGSGPLLRLTNQLRSDRVARFEQMVASLRRLGLAVDSAEVRALWPRAALGRKHLADWLVRSRQVPTHREVFERYLGDNGPACHPRPSIPCPLAIAHLIEAGGVSALAHPPRGLTDAALCVLKDAGMAAIEVSWPAQANNRVRQAEARAERLGLIPIAGSDFHAPDHSRRSIGCRTTTPANLGRLREACPSPARRNGPSELMQQA